MTEENEPQGDEKLTKVMYDACREILDCFVEGAPFKVTILLRCTDSPVAHVTCGNDSFEGAIEGLQQLIANKDTKARIVLAWPGAAKGNDSMTSFTPGPWEVCQTRYHADGCDRRNIRARDEVVAVVPARFRIAADEANARLIAAAPELYEALKAVCDEFYDDYPEWRDAKAALRKARGDAA